MYEYVLTIQAVFVRIIILTGKKLKMYLLF